MPYKQGWETLVKKYYYLVGGCAFYVYMHTLLLNIFWLRGYGSDAIPS